MSEEVRCRLVVVGSVGGLHRFLKNDDMATHLQGYDKRWDDILFPVAEEHGRFRSDQSTDASLHFVNSGDHSIW